MRNNKAVLLLNLGSPKSTQVSDVRAYLKEFLSDPRVIDGPKWIRAFVVNCCILPFRPKKSAKAYASIWQNEGSPLVLMSYAQQVKLQKKLPIPVELAMRYQTPSVAEAITRLHEQGINELLIVPLYPHYAMSSYETVVVEVMECIDRIAPMIETTLVQPFYQDVDYIEALVASAKPYIESNDFDQLLFSFHGIPQRHLEKTDPSHAHCFKTPNCCHTCHPAHATCYKHQCLQTVKAFVKKAGLKDDRYQISFQSRLGRDPWLEPYTDKVLAKLPKEGVKKLLVICPAFISDCLETLEEIQKEGKAIFMEHGGEAFTQIPCLNDQDVFINFLQGRVKAWLENPEVKSLKEDNGKDLVKAHANQC